MMHINARDYLYYLSYLLAQAKSWSDGICGLACGWKCGDSCLDSGANPFAISFC